MSKNKVTAGGAIFTRLKTLGVDYVFANSGTDFPPIIEGLAEARAKGVDLPKALVIPHEHAAMGMAHGYYLMTGKAQAVMLHTNVGLANGAIGAINAACDNIPVLLMSGRTPITESGRFGARTVPIGWGQEMRDQSALVRESCKWDYELKFPEQITEILDRAHAIANSTPKGPIYLSLPRETLCETIDESQLARPITMAPSTGAPDPAAITQAAQWLANAKAPLIIAQRGTGSEATFSAFSDWVSDWGIGVCTWWANQLPLPTDHPCHLGSDPGEALANADVVVVLNSLAPWWPDKHKLSPDCKVINIGPDPIFSRFPVRNFRSDLSISGETNLTIPALISEMAMLGKDLDIKARRERLATKAMSVTTQSAVIALRDTELGMTKEYVSHCLGEALDGCKSSVFSELGTRLTSIRRTEHKSWFQEPNSGGLGWCFPAALGALLAEPDRICVATMGDGSYMFANPTVCHQIAEALELPILVLVLNNEEWGAVRASVGGLYPDGYASKANEVPLTALKPSPNFCATASASRAWTACVEHAKDLPQVLRDALNCVRNEKRQALLDIKIL